MSTLFSASSHHHTFLSHKTLVTHDHSLIVLVLLASESVLDIVNKLLQGVTVGARVLVFFVVGLLV